MGREEWYSFPKDEKSQQLLKEKGIKDLPVKLKVGQELGGHKGFGYMHLLSHAKDFAKIGESPLLYLYNTMNKLSAIREENRRGRYRLRTEDEVQYEKGYITGKEDRVLYVELIEEENCYSIVTSYPREKSIYSSAKEEKELKIGRTLFRFTASNEQGYLGNGQETEEVATPATIAFSKAPGEMVREKRGVVNIYDIEVRGKGKNGEEVRYVQRGEGE